MTANLTNKKIDFLSNDKLVEILRSVLEEIDFVASHGANRSATYLAVSAIEGIFDELISLLNLQPSSIGDGLWPTYQDGYGEQHLKSISRLTLENKEKILIAANALPDEFKTLFETARKFRNYIHPASELKQSTPIAQSISQLSIACLNALIELYGNKRFVASQKWQVVYGQTQVPSEGVIHMPQDPGDHVSLLVSDLQSKDFREINFRVFVSPNAIFNIVYNYSSQDSFMAARIEGRASNGKGFDNGRLVCTKWRVWHISGEYQIEPDPAKAFHSVKIIFDSPNNLRLIIDDQPLELVGGIKWDFDPEGKLGFMSEHGLVTLSDLEVIAR